MAYSAEIDVKVRNLGSISQLEKKLSSISKSVNAINKKRLGGGASGGSGGGSAKSELSEEQKLIQLANKRLTIQNRGLGVTRQVIDLQTKGKNLDEATNNLATVKALTDQDQLDLAKNKILLADQQVKKKGIELRVEKDINAEVSKRAKFLKGAPTGFTAAQFGPQQAPTKGAGQAAMSIDTITKQSDKRLRIELKLRELEAKGVKTAKLRVKMGKLVDAQNRKQFGTIKQLNREIGRGIAKEESKLKLLQLQNRERAKAIKESAKMEAIRQGNFAGSGPGVFGPQPRKTFRQRIGATRGFDTQSALISGAFPLLFGQGPGGAIAGGLGGGIGGMFGTMGGFAGGIAATAAAQEIQKVLDFRKQVSALNMEMRSMGISSNISANSITKLGKSLGVTREEAVKVLEQFKRFGEESIGLAKFFDGDFALFEAFSQADNVSSVLNAIKKSSKDLTMEEELRITRLLTQKGVEAAINELIDVRREKIINLKKEQNKKRSTPKGSLVSGLGVGEAVNQSELSILTTTADKTIENLNKIKDNVTQQKFAVEEAGFSIVSEIEKIDKELRKLNNTQFQTVELSKTISSSFEDSFAGIVKGTMSVQDAFRNMLNSIANHFINTAAKMAANQLQRGLLGLFGNVLGGGLSSVAHGGINFIGAGQSSIQALTPIGSASQFIGSVKGFPTFADGGRPPVGRASIVGERGPELFVPNRSGTIIPNNRLGGGNNTSVVVNVDASGSDVQGDEEQATQFGSAIATAIQSELIRQQRPGGLLSR